MSSCCSDLWGGRCCPGPGQLGGNFPSAPFALAYNSNFTPLTIYNFGQFVNAPSLSGPANDAALRAMLLAMQNAPGLVGGMAWFPQYQVAASATGTGLIITDQTVFQGLGTGGAGSAQFLITGTTGQGDIFWNTNTGSVGHSEGGVFFRNLSFQWVNPTSTGSPTNNPDTAINLQTQSARVQDCVFIDCPTAVGFDGIPTSTGHGLGCTLERATVRYGIHATCPDNAVLIVMSGEQAQILGPTIVNQKPRIDGGPNGVTGLGWGGGIRGSEHQVVEGIHIADCQWGIDFSNRQGLTQLTGGALYPTLRDSQLGSDSTAFNLSLDQIAPSIIGGTWEGNTFYKNRQSQNDSNPIVLIDTLNEIGGSNPNIIEHDFVGNKIFSNVTFVAGPVGGVFGIAADNQYGVEIRGGADLRFIGGKIGQVGNNGTNVGGIWSDGSANVCITGGPIGGGPGNISFTGTFLGPKFAGQGLLGGGATGAGPTQYGVLVKGNFINGPAIFNGCNLLGFSGTGQAPLHVAAGAVVGTGSLYFNNCPGYNDQNTNILAGTGGALPLTAFKSATVVTDITGATTNYYGPSLFTAVSAGGTLKIAGGAAQAMNVGQLLSLPLGPYDTLQFSVAPTTPLWRGK